MDAQLTSLLANSVAAGVDPEELSKLTKVKKKTKPKYLLKPVNYRLFFIITLLICVLTILTLPRRAIRSPVTYVMDNFLNKVYDPKSNCLLSTNTLYSFDLTRRPAKCKFCRNVTKVPEVYNLTQAEFLENYAYTGVPVLLKGGANNWSALNIFSYEYFKKLYTDEKAIDLFEERECQFFNYKTNIYSLNHLFKMSKKRAALKKDQWYVGWSNCIESVQNILRKHYNRPKFLPDDSESSALDWIFMGGSGTGAMMHIDSVNRPSWQAMVKGKKTWFINPPPECEFHCSRHLSAVMEPSDILVIDTNKWYHSTFIHPGEMAITIGSEYD